jgi:hypothetical protein
MNGGIEFGNGGAVFNCPITGLGAGPYDIYLYVYRNSATIDYSVTAGATTYYGATAGNTFTEGTPAFGSPITSTTSGTYQAGYYVEFPGVTPVGGQITVTINYISGSANLIVEGLQLVSAATPFPQVPTLSQLSGIDFTIGLKFGSGNSGCPVVQSTDVAGFLSQANWNDFSGNGSANGGILADHNGVTTAPSTKVYVQWTGIRRLERLRRLR